MSKSVLVSAYNIHLGGGKVLLDKLLRQRKYKLTVLTDVRFDTSPYPQHEFFSFNPTFFDRLKAEIFLKKNHKNYDQVLCFGNLPPLFSLKTPTAVFLQNAYLVIPNVFNFVNIKSMLRLKFEKIWLTFRLMLNYKIYVQTRFMKKFIKEAGIPNEVLVYPFFEKLPGVVANIENKTINLLNVSSGDSHKNVSNLLDAIEILHKDGVDVRLKFILSPPYSESIIERINKINANKESIEVIQGIGRDKLLGLYKEVDALIFGSLFESFALPLIEARSFNLPIIASELDFVREACTPVQTFDPNSSTSIANAISRFCGVSEVHNEIYDASDFLTKVVEN